MANGLRFEKVTVDMLDLTRADWLATWEESDDKPPVYFEPLETCGKALAGKVVTTSTGSVVWYAVIPEGGRAALALVDMTHTGKGGQLRLHRVIVSPSLELSAGMDSQRAQYVASVAATALIGALGLTLEAHPSSTLKVWCSFPMTKEFLDLSFKPLSNHFVVHVAGNWLTIGFKKT